MEEGGKAKTLWCRMWRRGSARGAGHAGCQPEDSSAELSAPNPTDQQQQRRELLLSGDSTESLVGEKSPAREEGGVPSAPLP